MPKGEDGQLGTDQREIKLVFDSTVSLLASTRRILFLLSAVAGIGFFHVIIWYCSWDLARIEARKSAVSRLEQHIAVGEYYTGNLAQDAQIVADLKKQTAVLEKRWADRRIKVFVVGFDVSAADFSISLLLLANGLYLWLILHQRRILYCFDKLGKLAGAKLPFRVLEYHLTFVGSHSTPAMKWAARLLFLALPFLALIFLLSDVFDLCEMAHRPVHELAFETGSFIHRAVGRVFMDLLLGLACGVLGFRSFREHLKLEEKVTKFFTDPVA